MLMNKGSIDEKVAGSMVLDRFDLTDEDL